MPFLESPETLAIDGCLIHSRSRPSCGSQTGGDGLFHEAARGDGRLMLLLVDVSGHGDAASPYIDLLSRRMLADPLTGNLSPSELLGRLHGMLAPVWAEDEVFVCATAIASDRSRSTAAVACAGMPPPLWGVLGESASVWSEAPEGTPLGLPFEVAAFEERSLEMAGRTALFFTDGVNEAQRLSEGNEYELFGHERVQTLFQMPIGGEPRPAFIERLFNELASFVGEIWPEDDTTTVCLGFESLEPAAESNA
jgi:serine phosphatase RsbU (regulator of sigma subunit)